MSKSGVKYACMLKNGTIDYTLDQQLDRGGEGEIYGIQNHPELVAKIYRKDKPGREEKLKALLKQNVQCRIQGLVRLAMPEGLLYANGKMVGYVMPKVDTKLKLFKLWRENDSDKSRIFPNYGWHHALQIAYNLAEIINYLHQCGVIIGDFNPNNFVVDPQNGGRPVLVDCDSFDIYDPDTHQHFPCEVAFEEMAAPEIQTAGIYANAKFSEASDNFSLAIQIFRLLMNNQDPFGSKYIGVNKPSSSACGSGNKSILRGECAYVRYIPNKIVPQNLMSIDVLPNDIKDLFVRAFSYDEVTAIQKATLDKRPSAKEWKDVLEKYAVQHSTYVLTCPKNGIHKYSNHLQQCPWCDLEARRGKNVVPPNPVPFGTTTNKNNLFKKKTLFKKNAGASGAGIPAGGSSGNQLTNIPQQAGSNNVFVPGQPRRDSKLYLALLMIFGIAGGFLVQELFFSSGYPGSLDEYGSAFTIAVVGIIYGLIVYYYTRDRYMNAIDSVPWLLLTLTGLVVPGFIVGLFTTLVWIVMFVISVCVFLFCCCTAVCRKC